MMHYTITLMKTNEYFAFSPCVREGTRLEQKGTQSLVTLFYKNMNHKNRFWVFFWSVSLLNVRDWQKVKM